MSMKVLITGDRDWTDIETIRAWLSKLQDWGCTIIIEGGARGADKIAGSEARRMGMKVIEVPADWSRYGKGAGLIRNQEMLELKPDLVVAFHSDLPRSKGTTDMVRRARKEGVEVILVKCHYQQ